MLQGQKPAYDMAITVFSPDGRLFQVQYAQEAVKRGTPSIGMEYRSGVLLLATKNISSKLMVADTVRKIFKVDDHLGVAISGLVADARRLVDMAREEAQKNSYLYNEKIPVDVLTKEVSRLKQLHTQYGSARPFGVSLLIGGIDEKGKHVFETDPSGAYAEYTAKATGANAEKADELLQKKFKPNLDLESAIKLAIGVLKEISEDKLPSHGIDGVTITKEGYNVVPQDMIEKYLNPRE